MTDIFVIKTSGKNPEIYTYWKSKNLYFYRKGYGKQHKCSKDQYENARTMFKLQQRSKALCL